MRTSGKKQVYTATPLAENEASGEDKQSCLAISTLIATIFGLDLGLLTNLSSSRLCFRTLLTRTC